jgi:hypothetical protein
VLCWCTKLLLITASPVFGKGLWNTLLGVSSPPPSSIFFVCVWGGGVDLGSLQRPPMFSEPDAIAFLLQSNTCRSATGSLSSLRGGLLRPGHLRSSRRQNNPAPSFRWCLLSSSIAASPAHGDQNHTCHTNHGHAHLFWRMAWDSAQRKQSDRALRRAWSNDVTCHLAQAILGSIPTGEEDDLDQKAGSEEDVGMEVCLAQRITIPRGTAEVQPFAWPVKMISQIRLAPACPRRPKCLRPNHGPKNNQSTI